MSSPTTESVSRSHHRVRGARSARSPRAVYLGDDDHGRALEIMAVEGKQGELLVIRAMELRDKYRKRYEDAG